MNISCFAQAIKVLLLLVKRFQSLIFIFGKFFQEKKGTCFICVSCLFLVFSSISYAEKCDFTAKVHPEERHNRTKIVYEEVCNWYYKLFGTYPAVPLTEVHFVSLVDETDTVSVVVGNNTQKHSSGFCCGELNENKIHIDEEGDRNSLINASNSRVYFDSILAHEIIHFLVKSANADRFVKSKAGLNKGMYEAFAYWGQNKFIERHSKYSLPDFILKDNDLKYTRADNFEQLADLIYRHSIPYFVFNAIYFFDDNLQEKHDKLIDNKFP